MGIIFLIYKMISKKALDWWQTLTDKERFNMIEEGYQESCGGI